VPVVHGRDATGGEEIAPHSLSAVAAFRDFRVATGILDVAEETQCCRPPAVWQKNKVLTALVEAEGVRK
jgi:hypothetical protein